MCIRDRPRTVQLDVGMTRRILGIGIPSAFENSLFEAGRILVVSMISTFGTVQIAANAVANNLDGMGVIPGKALSLAIDVYKRQTYHVCRKITRGFLNFLNKTHGKSHFCRNAQI